jgi:dihydrofolate reductase
MRKMFLQMMISLDGSYQGPNGELDWHEIDPEFDQYAVDMLNGSDLLLFGRKTYDLMAAYWPDPKAIADDPLVAERMNSLPKVVVSRTRQTARWAGTRVLNKDIEKELKELKQGVGKDIAVLGSSDLGLTLLSLGLIDELRIIITPVILGNGKPLFQGLRRRFPMKLTGTRTFSNKNVLLIYSPVYSSSL